MKSTACTISLASFVLRLVVVVVIFLFFPDDYDCIYAFSFCNKERREKQNATTERTKIANTHCERARARERMRQFDYAKKTRLLSLTFEAS